ncbi:MAG TPA: prepilin-type N-terminal cleavage/methylation domain-containing protein [Gemmatimonadaceae bacterium]|nr:prepilin-type N-terminal cleavage/methylation domain-containing protein [Gemmatimonadaceae bacterium]
MNPLRGRRGFTLIELMVTLAVTMIVMGLVVMTVNAQQKAFSEGQRQRAAQQSARSAMLYLQRELRLAGYGMDASLAFDFDRYRGPCPAELDPCPRDATDNADEIVFYHRNPMYWVPDDFTQEPRGNAWRITNMDPAGNEVTVSARPGDTILQGQVVQAVCRTAALYAYFTVERTVTADPSNVLTLPLLPVVASDPFRRQDAAADSCFDAGQARLFLIDRFRFHVRPVRDGARWFPFLVLDRGVDVNGDGSVDEGDESLLAEGIEALQFSYVMTNPAMTVHGECPGDVIVMERGWPGLPTGADHLTLLDFPGVVQAGQSVYEPTSFYGYSVGPPATAMRNTDHQANIRAVRVFLRGRSPEADRGFTGLKLGESAVVLPFLNQDELPNWAAGDERYGRSNLTTTVALRNMIVRGMTDY